MLPHLRTRFLRVGLALAAGLLAAVGTGARAEVEHVVRWLPGDGQADGYRVHVGDRSGAYTRTIDFGNVAPDGDGIRRRTILLDETRDHYLAMDAYNVAGMSGLSNEIRVEALACNPAACHDGNVCTVDTCANGSCSSQPVADGTLCGSGNRVCLRGRCRTVQCLGAADCDDGDVCNGDESCSSFSCTPGAALDCGAPTQCTAPACDPVRGCTTELVPDGIACDDGVAATVDDRCQAGRCRGDRVAPRCGDGHVDAGEECDDGDVVGGDGCSAQCFVEVCGNGRLDVGEGCDDGNTAPGDGCEPTCAASGCGDGSLAPDEECDDGNATSGDGCDANCRFTSCGNGVVTDGELCDDGNLEDGDGCSALCEVDRPVATREQSHCVSAVNRGVARVARVQGRVNARCFGDWVKGRVERLGPPPGSLRSCMAADPEQRVARAREQLAERAEGACRPGALPDLALGPDLLAGAPAASSHAVGLMADLFVSSAAVRLDDASAARCQRQVARRATRVFDAFWSTLVSAKARKLRGRGTEPAASDEELSIFLEAALADSGSLARASSRLVRVVERCADAGDPAELFPGCAVDPDGLAACADRSARCRACLVLSASDPRLSLDCDWLDDGELDASCQP